MKLPRRFLAFRVLVLVSACSIVIAQTPAPAPIEVKQVPMLPAEEERKTIQLPDGYEAETHGNLERVATQPEDGAGVLRLRKLLCRDERPTLSVFYSRAGLAE